MNFRYHMILLATLLATWFLLSGYTRALLLGLGLLSCIFCHAVYHRIRAETGLGAIALAPMPLARYTAWLLLEIVKSNISVIRAIVSGRNLCPRIFDIPTSNLNELGQVIYANSITLTPGTVSTQVAEGKIRVHGLLKGAESGLADNRMRTRVEQLVSD